MASSSYDISELKHPMGLIFYSFEVLRRDFDGSETPNARYLHHHGSDGADTLRFDSTDECFKTVEYEHKRSTELRDIARKCLYFALESACSTAGDTLDLM